MGKYTFTYKGRTLHCNPIAHAEGGWLTSLFIQEDIGDSTQETKFCPDDNVYALEEDAAAAAASFGKGLIDKLSEQS